MHWADSSSVGLLAYLVRRLADWPLLLVLSWQAEQAGRLRVLRTALGEAEDQSLGEVIEPGLLGPEAIGALLSLDGMPRVDVDRLMAETRGLPMLVREYVEALRSAGEAAEPGPEQADWWPPASVRDLLRARLQTVSEPTRQMLTAAAVLGSDNDADLLRAVSGRGEDEIVEALDEALARSLLTETPPVRRQPGAVVRIPLRGAAPDRLRIGHAGPAPAAAQPGGRHPHPAARAGSGHDPGRDHRRSPAAGRPRRRRRAVVVAGRPGGPGAVRARRGARPPGPRPGARLPAAARAARPGRGAGRARPVPGGTGRVRDRRRTGWGG